jgi:glycosyltransferase involved in cell wall biosynthesis
MPVYNSEMFLDETIKSILNQTFKNFEFIIIDDCSTDNSWYVINQYQDERIRLYKNDKNLGYIITLNKLISLSNGKYIARQDNDDISLPNRLNQQVDFLEKNPEYALCGSNGIIFGRKNRKTYLPISYDDIKALFLVDNPFNHSSVMMKKIILNSEENFSYNIDLCPAEDYYLWYQFSKKYPIKNLKEPYLFIRLHENNFSLKKKSIQLKKANEIRVIIVQESLDLVLSEREIELLFLFDNSDNMDLQSLLDIEKLLKKLYDRNEIVKYYSEESIKKTLFYFWSILYYKKNRINFFLKSYYYFKSNLFSLRYFLKLLYSEIIRNLFIKKKI